MAGDEVDFDRFLPADEAALGPGLRAGPLALGKVKLEDFLGHVVGEEHPLAGHLRFGFLDDKRGVLPGFVDDGGGLEAFEEERQLLGVHLFALAAEELRLEFFELPLGVLSSAAFLKMTLSLFGEEALAFIDEALDVRSDVAEHFRIGFDGSELGEEFVCGESVDVLLIAREYQDAIGNFVRTGSSSRELLFRYQRRGFASFKSRPPRSIASCS